jgi:multidrug efflux system membrane fusion protein
MESLKEAMNRINGRGAGLGLVLAALLTGCEAQSDSTAALPPPPAVDVAEVLEEPVTLWDSFTGRVESPATVDLRPRVTGYITEVAFKEGQLVEEGDLLFQIDPRPYQARVEAARADLAMVESQLELARSEAGRAKTLWESRAISREEFDQRQSALASALAGVASAQAALDIAELDLCFTRVTAPVSGRTGRALVTRGNLANADQSLLTTLVSMDPLYVYFEADEKAAADVQRLLADGEFPAVRVSMGADNQHQYLGLLDFIDNRLNPGTGTLQYRAVLDNPGGMIRPGQFARVEMPVAELESALLVQRKAVLADQDRRYVYVVDENNRATPRHIISGPQVGDLLIIEEGLNQGELIIINGVQKVFGAGMEVSPQLIAMKEPDKTGTAVAVMQGRAQ